MKIAEQEKQAASAIDTEKIARHFGHHAAGYERYANLQMQTAAHLAGRLPAAEGISSVLELGCGTGFLSCQLQKKYPDASLVMTDLSQEMLDVCKEKTGRKNAVFARLDATHPPVDIGRFDLIVSGMTFQWLADPVASLRAWQHRLTPKGRLYYSAPAPGSFMQWRKVLQQMGVSVGLLDTPDLPGQDETVTYVRSYLNALHFFSDLRRTGANLPRPGYRPLKTGQLRRALRALDRQGTPLEISWRIQYGCLKAGRGYERAGG